MAEAYDVALAPHCPLGPIALAACLNVDATSGFAEAYRNVRSAILLNPAGKSLKTLCL